MLSQTSDDCSSAPMPNIDRPMIATKPSVPPATVKRAFLRPCSAPCVSASRPFGPGESDRPVAASR